MHDVLRPKDNCRGKFRVLPSQAEAHNLDTKFRGFSGPVGSGKTAWLVDHLIHLAYANSRIKSGSSQPLVGVLGAPTYRMLRDSSLRQLRERLDHHNVPYRETHERVHLLEPDTEIMLRTLDDPDRLRGPNISFFGVDEASYCPELSWLQLEARLRHPKAIERAGIAAWTPKGFDWVYQRFVSGAHPQYKAIFAKPFENTHLPGDYYRDLLKSYSPAFARQEILGEYLNIFSGRVYSGFESAARGNIWKPGKTDWNYRGFAAVEYKSARPILWALDFNVNPATSVICQTVPMPGFEAHHGFMPSKIGGPNMQLNVLDALFLPDTTTAEHCEAFYERVKQKMAPGRKLHVIVYGDASGERRQSSAAGTDYTIIQNFFRRYHSEEFNLEVRVPTQNPLIKDRIQSVNGMCMNYNRTRRLAVHERCKELIKDLEQVAYATDSYGNLLPVLSKKDPQRGHISDALGYLVWAEFGLRSTVGEIKQSVI